MRTKRGFLFLLLAWCGTTSVAAQEPIERRQLGIEEMFAIADQSSRSIRSHTLAEREAEAAVRVAKNDRLPSIDFSASASYLGDGWMADRNFQNGMNAPMPHFGNNFAVEASQVIYAGGAVESSVELSQLNLRSAQISTEQNRQDIRFLLVGNYLELYKLNNQAAVYRRNIEQTERLLDEIRAKHREGLAIRNDITRYELQLQSLQLGLTQIENSRIIINHRLVTTLDLPANTMIEPDTTILRQMPALQTEQFWQQTATDLSPALQQAQLAIERTEQGVKLARAGHIPSLALFAGDHLDGPVTIEVPPLNKNFNYWYVGIGLNFNIGSLYKGGKEVRRAKYAVAQATERELLAQEHLSTDVKAAYVRFNEAFTTFAISEKSFELATENYAVVENRYLHDLALITDMLDAANSKLSAELEVANARINILFNYYRLKKVAGDL